MLKTKDMIRSKTKLQIFYILMSLGYFSTHPIYPALSLYFYD